MKQTFKQFLQEEAKVVSHEKGAKFKDLSVGDLFRVGQKHYFKTKPETKTKKGGVALAPEEMKGKQQYLDVTTNASRAVLPASKAKDGGIKDMVPSKSDAHQTFFHDGFDVMKVTPV